MMIQVFCRYVLNNSLTWPEELSCYAHIWYAMLGISYATRRGLHLRVDTLVNILPKPARVALNFLADLMLMVFFIYMVYYGVGVVATVYQTNQVSPAMRVPMWTIYISLLIGCAMAAIRLIEKWCMDIKRMRNPEKGAEE